jgi:acetyl esterase/lipase
VRSPYSPPASQHWSLVAEMSCKIPALVTIVSYPLAPNSPAKDSIPHLSKLYHTILEESESKDEIVTFMGDSAGGNVAICLVLYILSKETEAKVPSSLFLISPCADARNTNPDMKATDRLDPLLDSGYTDDVAAKWSIGLDRADPMVSPLLGDMEILKRRSIRLDGLVGTYDVLAPDALLLVEKARQAGVAGRWLKWDGQMHCFLLTW